MPFDDLDLEFEDEDETKKKKKAEDIRADVDGAKRPLPTASTVSNIVDLPPPKPSPVVQKTHVAGSSALKVNFSNEHEPQQISELREELRQAEVKVAIAEFKVEYLSEMLSDMKLVEHQVTQLLMRINAKHPDIKNEALMIKKILADFITKKRR